MHAFLTGIFEGVVLGIAIVLLLASVELRKADLDRHAPNDNGPDGPTSPSRPRKPLCPSKPICLDYLAALNTSARAIDSELDGPAGRPPAGAMGQPSPIGLVLR